MNLTIHRHDQELKEYENSLNKLRVFCLIVTVQHIHTLVCCLLRICSKSFFKNPFFGGEWTIRLCNIRCGSLHTCLKYLRCAKNSMPKYLILCEVSHALIVYYINKNKKEQQSKFNSVL